MKYTLFAVLALALGCAGGPESTPSDEDLNKKTEIALPENGEVPAPRTPWNDAARRVAEAGIQASASPERCADHLRRATAVPHPPGSRANLALGRAFGKDLAEWGYQVEHHRYEVLVPLPVSTQVEMTSPLAYSAAIEEPPLDQDFDTHSAETLPPFAAFGADGDVEGELVYANYGRAEDFASLAESGIEVSGRVVLIRYGQIYRGSKVWLAEQQGAAAVILFSDPADQGFARGEVIPRGRFRPDAGAERGTVLYTFIQPGDPGTPGRASLPDEEQLRFGEMKTLPRIPVAVLSFAAARPLLENLDGPVAPSRWRGAGSFTYKLGGNAKATARVAVTSDYRLHPIEVVEAVWAGGELAEEEIILGCHRDAWTHGAIDPGSGSAVMMETARLFADAHRGGLRPKRTLRILSFGGEELGLVGSTEWMEDRGATMNDRTVLFVDLDAAVSGPRFEIEGLASWSTFMSDLSTDSAAGSGRAPQFQKPGLDGDHAPFLGHLGIGVVAVGRRGEHGAGHSRYDTFSNLKRHIDPNFEWHADVAGFAARLAYRLASTDILPIDLAALAASLQDDVKVFAKAHPELDLGALLSPLEEARLAGVAINKARTILSRRRLDGQLTRKIDRALIAAERSLLLDTDQNSTAFWRHLQHAPTPGLGYGGARLPHLDSALRRGRDEAQAMGARYAQALREFRNKVASAQRIMEAALPQNTTQSP